MPVYELDPLDPAQGFPDPELALDEPNGLLALGGDLSTPRLLNAYAAGIFPWYAEGQPILWWSPDPRTVLTPGTLHVSRRLARTLRRGRFEVTANRAFDAVIEACSAPRAGQDGTWLLPEMRAAYRLLHRHGHAASVECWHEGELAGGVYGVQLGRVFFGESMFTRVTDASKVALVHLLREQVAGPVELLDCQVASGHLHRLGAFELPRTEFLGRLAALLPRGIDRPPWHGN